MKNSKAIISLILIIAIFSCRKNDKENPPGPPATTVEKLVIDTSKSELISSAEEMTAGIFRYINLPGAEAYKKGDFLLDPHNDGYLRIIETVTSTGGEVRFTTSQGTIEQFYKDSGDVHKIITFPDADNPFLRVKINNDGTIEQGRTTLSIPSFKISGNGISFDFTEMTFNFDPTLTYDFNILKSYLKLGFQNVKTTWRLSVNATLELNNREITDTFRLSKVLPKFTSLIKLPFQAGLFWGYMELSDCYIELKAKGNTELQVAYDYEEINNTVAYVEYSDGSLKAVYDKKNQSFKKESDVKIIGDAGFSISIIPVFKIYCYRIPVVQIGAAAGIFLDWKFKPSTALWNSEYSFGGEVFGQLDNSHYAFLAGDLRFSKQFERISIYKAPSDIRIVSGTDQKAIKNQPLTKPIVLKVIDSEGKGQGPVKVFYSSNFGKWEKESVLSTPLTGSVSNNFKIGDTDEEHILTATIKDAGEKVIKTVEIKLKPTVATPASILILSGNNQSGTANTNLSNPLVVVVKDINGQAVSGVPVTWTITAGGGQLTSSATNTNSDGQASNTWKLGASGTQTITATVKNADGSHISGSPISFHASIPDGSVTIGSQIWMLKNLDVTTYRNGDTIPQVTDPTQWTNLKTGAWCYYNNDPANNDVYGKMYNWYAVNDPRGLAPQGWHIPNLAEWTTLINYLGGEEIAGGKLKATTRWQSPNTAATNSSGFTAFGGGERYTEFQDLNILAVFWTSTAFDISNAFAFHVEYDHEYVSWGYDYKVDGYSARCIKD